MNDDTPVPNAFFKWLFVLFTIGAIVVWIGLSVGCGPSWCVDSVHTVSLDWIDRDQKCGRNQQMTVTESKTDDGGPVLIVECRCMAERR